MTDMPKDIWVDNVGDRVKLPLNTTFLEKYTNTQMLIDKLEGMKQGGDLPDNEQALAYFTGYADAIDAVLERLYDE